MDTPEITQLPRLELPNGLKVDGRTRLCTDWQGMRSLYESGMALKDIADAYKVSATLVRAQARREDWVNPTKVNKLRREIEAKQRSIWKKSGKASDVAAIKSQIWDERGEELKEKTYEIVRNALDGVTPEKAKGMVKNALGLMHITTVARQITGEEAKEAESGTKLAVSIGLLRSGQVLDAPVIEAELVGPTA
jgi:hypothetical protein